MISCYCSMQIPYPAAAKSLMKVKLSKFWFYAIENPSWNANARPLNAISKPLACIQLIRSAGINMGNTNATINGARYKNVTARDVFVYSSAEYSKTNSAKNNSPASIPGIQVRSRWNGLIFLNFIQSQIQALAMMERMVNCIKNGTSSAMAWMAICW